MSAMRMENAGDCILCGLPGAGLYGGLTDRIFSVEGSFDYKFCRSCGLIWMDPRPVNEDIGKCYERFYNVSPQGEEPANPGIIKKIKKAVREAIFCGHYGYRHIHSAHNFCKAGTILRRMPLVGPAAVYGWEALMPYAKDVRNGLVVDVGCGRGEFLEILLKLGCSVLGIEPDAAGYGILKNKVIPAFNGTLEGARLADNSVSHITMRHVIEHLPDPAGTVNECWRVLTQGGKLVIRTPNGSSIAHMVFKKNWYQLDPPRHLYVFSPKSMSILCNRSRFASHRLRTLSFSAKGVYDASVMIKRFGTIGSRRIAPQYGRRLFSIAMHTLEAAGMPWGEELEVVLTKGKA